MPEPVSCEAASRRAGGNDAIAFTSGPSGAPFSAGVVHAWLASDRLPPLVATGISAGSLAAAAVRRAYQELEHIDGDELEVKRWRWYQRYYRAITDNPFAPLWKAFPDPVDFFAETLPVRDPAVEQKFAGTVYDQAFKESAEKARRHFYLLVKIGGWLGTLPVRVSSLATVVVMSVRLKEGYGRFTSQWCVYRPARLVHLLAVLLGVWWHLVMSPRWVWESGFTLPGRKGSGLRPLFGWPVYCLAWALPAFPAVLATVAVLRIRHGGTMAGLRGAVGLTTWGLTIFLLMLVAMGVAAYLLYKHTFPAFRLSEVNKEPVRSKLGQRFIDTLTKHLDIAESLLHPFQMQDALFDLFVKDAPAHVLAEPRQEDVIALFVCAALEETEQISLKPAFPVVKALTAALSVPGLLPPQNIDASDVAPLPPLKGKEAVPIFKAIDGAAVRNNPLPAFFEWAKSPACTVAPQLERADPCDPSLHVVYSVPVAHDGSVQDVEGMKCPDIVQSATIALQLARRRDTRQEVRQANDLSRLETIRRRNNPGSAGAGHRLAIFADEIAPRNPIDLGSDVNPDAGRLATTVADGCRGTLEALYHREIAGLLGSADTVPCRELLQQIAPRRAASIGPAPGLSAVCQACCKLLSHRPPQRPEMQQPGLLRSYGNAVPSVAEALPLQFPQLVDATPADVRPKIVFLGSGGVFRGAFHIGVLAAISQTKLYPDLVVGASVGTLMGGALCRLTALPDDRAGEVLSDLTDTFTQVDARVAVTATLKRAVKQLGTRARSISLSPAKLAHRVRAGSQSDAGYAATGAPPALTDAITSLLTIPHRRTISITADFVAGHFAAATGDFLRQLRRETLPAFDIQYCLMGITLLERTARKLMAFSDHGHELTLGQPYQTGTPSGRQVAFFGTTSYLNAAVPLVLGRDFLSTGHSWNAVQAGLCSSAFPTVFSARSEADLRPGIGRPDRFFADGGMFDNLPFLPALEVLGDVQAARVLPEDEELRALLLQRSARPSIILCAGLNAKPERDPGFKADTMFAIQARASVLEYESKTKTFQSSLAAGNQIFADIVKGDFSLLKPDDKLFLSKYVPAEIVDITPVNAAHINPTFAFCKTLGMVPERISTSIADGCYQTLSGLTSGAALPVLQTKRTVVGRRSTSRQKRNTAGHCPYFEVDGEQFLCPFKAANTSDSASKVYEVCIHDPSHKVVG